jgi:hypothetical protein
VAQKRDIVGSAALLCQQRRAVALSPVAGRGLERQAVDLRLAQWLVLLLLRCEGMITKMQGVVSGLTVSAAAASLLLVRSGGGWRLSVAGRTLQSPRPRRHQATGGEVQLGELWASAVEVMLCGDVLPPPARGGQGGGDVILVPGATPPPGGMLPLPPLMQTHVVFALTAFNPPGVERTLEQNSAANARLWASLRDELSPAPRVIWPSWGFHREEGWREDGFALAYPMDIYRRREQMLDARARAREAVLRLAARYEQGAIFGAHHFSTWAGVGWGGHHPHRHTSIHIMIPRMVGDAVGAVRRAARPQSTRVAGWRGACSAPQSRR